MGRLTRTDKLLDHILQLLAQEYGYDGRRRLICAKSVVVARIRCGFPKQVRMTVHCLQNAGEHQQELDVLVRRLARIQHVDAVVRGQGPVVVLAGSVNTLERLLVEQALHTVLARHSLERLHDDLVVVHRDIRLGIDGGQLMLRRSHLVVLGLRRHAHFPQFFIDILHEGCDPLADRSEVVVVHLLALRRHRAEQGASGIDQVLPLQELVCIYKEIFLLRADRGRHFF